RPSNRPREPEIAAIRNRVHQLALRRVLCRPSLTLYQFNTGQAKHYFCSVCGIYTFHSRRSVPSQYGVNVACIVGLSPFDFDEVPVLEGRSHPKDWGDGEPMTAGWFSYRANTGQKR
ncbi:MAG: hypothetical protein PWQ61_433, partial [Betaproteobacteria bacterium]|nr:hypothetical protein [Betaproteobacteria bacterium]